MITAPTPSSLLPAELVNSIRSYSAAAEHMERLQDDQLQLIFDQNWFNLFTPRAAGGLEMDLPSVVRLQESLAWADGSFGWTVTLCSGAHWFIGFLNEDIAGDIFSNKQVCLAGSGAFSGKASIAENGYIVNGYWKYATGSAYATAFTANCLVEKNGVPLLEKDGSRMIRSFIFKRGEVEIHQEWNAIGMKATASQSFSVKELKADRSRCFLIDPAHAVLPQPVFYFPFLQLAEVTLAANYSGICIHFMELCNTLFEEKIQQKRYSIQQSAEMREALSHAESNVKQYRVAFYDALVQTWHIGLEEKRWPDTSLKKLSKLSHLLVNAARKAIDELYPYCGMAGANLNTEINRVWRDFHTASQHMLFTFENE